MAIIHYFKADNASQKGIRLFGVRIRKKSIRLNLGGRISFTAIFDHSYF